MASASDSSNPTHVDSDLPTPGLLELPLAVNNGPMTGKQEKQAWRKLNRRLPLLERELCDRPIRHGSRNLVGLLYYRLGQKHKAIEFWEKTVGEDPTNLNAIQDLSTAYAEIGLHIDSGRYKEQLDSICSKLSGNPDDEKRVYARCMAEQAHASCWDIHTNTWSNGQDGMEKKVKLFKSALEWAGSLISQDEKEDWCLGIGQAYERLSHMYFRRSNYPKYHCSIENAAKYLHYSISSSKHILHKAEAWCVLGNALTYDLAFESNYIPRFVRQKYLAEWNYPSLCFDMALSLDPGSSWILGCYGKLYLKHQNYPAAINVLNESIENDPSASSWFSYDLRSKVYKQLAKEERDHDRKKTYLLQAEQDSHMADEFNPNPRSASARGEIAHGLARCATTEEESKRCSLEALGHFSESFEIQDGTSISDAHLKQGKCLLKRDRWSAVQSFKMAFDTNTSPEFCDKIAEHHMIPSMLDEYSAQDKPDNLCAELAFWIIDSNARCTRGLFQIIGILARKRKYQEYILDVIEYLVENQPTHEGVDSMITAGFQTLRKTKYSKANFERLCSLQRNHSAKVQSLTPVTSTPDLHDHRPPEKARNPNCQNDFYVITAKASTPWVQYSLLPGMECRFFGLKGFYQERDNTLGQQRFKSQVKAISESAKVLIVLTESVSTNTECQHLFEMACVNKKPSMIAILKCDATAVPKEMSHFKQFDFSRNDAPATSKWFDLAKFLLRKE